MKTLILTGGNFPQKEKALPLLRKIFEFDFSCTKTSSDIFIIAADSGLNIAVNYGLTPDLILGDLDSVQPEILKKFQNLPQTTFIRDKDYPDTELALKTAKEKKSEVTVLLGGGGGRSDHFFAIERFFESELAPDFWIPDEINIIAKIEGETSEKENFLTKNKDPDKKFLKNTFIWNNFYSEDELEELFSVKYDEKTAIDDRLMISVFPIKTNSTFSPDFCSNSTSANYNIEDSGLFWTLKNVDWKNGNYSLSNRPASKNTPVQLKAHSGRFIVIFRI